MACQNLPFGIDVEWLKENFLFGIDLTDDNGKPLEDNTIKEDILAAVEYLESALDISLSLKCVTNERHDYTLGDEMRAFTMVLDVAPVREVKAVRFMYGDQPGIEIPLSWVQIRNANNGTVQLLPGWENAILTSGWPWIGGGFMLLSRQRRGYGRDIPATYPGAIEIDYVAGFDGVKYPMPNLLRKMIGLQSSIKPLIFAGNLIVGAGIASSSIGIDGLSQSVNTTNSAEYSGYGSTVKDFKEEYTSTMKMAAKQYARPKFAAL